MFYVIIFYNLLDFSIFFFDIKIDHSQVKNHTAKIEDFKDWLKCIGGSDEILLDHKLMFKTNFNVNNIFIVSHNFFYHFTNIYFNNLFNYIQEQVYELMEEAEMMENLGINLHVDIRMLLAKKNSLLDDIRKVKIMVNTYNTFISSMKNAEVSLFL